MPRGVSPLDEARLQGRLWTPAQVLPALWLDADDAGTITLNGSNVSQWRDKSGKGRNASQGTAANQPAYVTGSYNGKPTVRSDGLNDFLSITPFSVSAGIRAYGVINPRNPPTVRRNGDWLWMTNLLTGSPHFSGHDNNLARNWFSSFFSTSRPQITATNIPPNTLHLSYIEQTGGALKGRVFGLIPESTAAAAFNGSPTAVFQLFSTVAGSEAAFDISEIVFAQSPTLDQQQRIEGYLAWKWGLTANLPAEHPYRNRPPLIGN